MQFHPIQPGGVGRVVDAMKPLVARRQELEAGIIGHSLERAVEGNDACWLQCLAQFPDFILRQHLSRKETDSVSTFLESIERNSANRTDIFDCRVLRCRLGYEKHALNPRQVRDLLAQHRADLARFFRHALGFPFDDSNVSFDPGLGPVLDLNDLDSGRADGNYVDLVGLAKMRGRESEIRQQEPLVASGLRPQA